MILQCPHCGANVEATPGMAGFTAECPSCRGKMTIEPQQLDSEKRKVYVRHKPSGQTSEQSNDSGTLRTIAAELRQLNTAVSSIRWMIFWVIISPFLAAIVYAIFAFIAAF